MKSNHGEQFGEVSGLVGGDDAVMEDAKKIVAEMAKPSSYSGENGLFFYIKTCCFFLNQLIKKNSMKNAVRTFPKLGK